MKYKTVIKIRDLSLMLNIGAFDYERKNPQEIKIECNIYFDKMPSACLLDDLNESICYAQVIKIIQEFSNDKSFALIEHYGFSLLEFLKMHIIGCRITLSIIKKPVIADFHGTVAFCIST